MKTVRNALAVSLLGILAASPAPAQNVTWGLTGGMNLATFGGDDAKLGGTSEPENRMGFRIGGTLEYEVSDVVSVQPELAWSQKGAMYKDGADELTFRYGYLDLPVLAKVRPRVGGGVVQPFLAIGPALSYMATCSLREDEGTQVTTLDCDDSAVNLPVKKLDLSMVLGGGAEFTTGRGQFTLDARYGLGLRSTDDSSTERDVKNRGFSFQVGYTIGLAL